MSDIRIEVLTRENLEQIIEKLRPEDYEEVVSTLGGYEYITDRDLEVFMLFPERFVAFAGDEPVMIFGARPAKANVVLFGLTTPAIKRHALALRRSAKPVLDRLANKYFGRELITVVTEDYTAARRFWSRWFVDTPHTWIARNGKRLRVVAYRG